MGKVKRERKKLHIQAVRSPQEDAVELAQPLEPLVQPTLKPQEESLEGIKINQRPQVQKQRKKTKREERRERWLKKLDASYELQQETKKAKERAKTVIVGDMQLLASALPTLPAVTEMTTRTNKGAEREDTSKPNPKKMSQKRRRKQQMADMENFRQVLAHPAFQSNPMSAISEHVKNLVQREHTQS